MWNWWRNRRAWPADWSPRDPCCGKDERCLSQRSYCYLIFAVFEPTITNYIRNYTIANIIASAAEKQEAIWECWFAFKTRPQSVETQLETYSLLTVNKSERAQLGNSEAEHYRGGVSMSVLKLHDRGLESTRDIGKTFLLLKKLSLVRSASNPATTLTR